MRRLLPTLLLSAVVSAGCHDSIPGLPSGTGPQLKENWVYNLSGGQGVAVNPATGAIYVSVGTSTRAPFVEGGGIEVFSPAGAKVASVPMVLPACDGCVRLRFTPRGPQVSPDGRYAYVSDFHLNLFRLDTGSLKAEPMAVPGAASLTLVSLDRNSAVSADGRHAYLPGTQLTALDLDEGTLADGAAPEGYVRQIVPFQGSRYLLNLTGNWDSEGTVAIWDAATGVVATSTLKAPLRALASRDGWTVGILEPRATMFQAVELDFASEPPKERLLAEFRLDGGNDISLAIRPEKKQVAVGTGGIQAITGGVDAGPANVKTFPGSTLLIDATHGPIAFADTSSVKGLALSPDGSTLYVADTGGLKAFALP